MKSKLYKILKVMLFILLSSIVFGGIGYLIALLISRIAAYPIAEVLSYEGLAFILIGVLMSMKGNPSAINIQGIGQNSAQYIANQNIAVTLVERESTNYYKNFLKHSVTQFSFVGTTIIIGGALLLLFSLLLF